MKKPILTALALFILTPNGALDAGPWLREKGESFTSFSLSASLFRDTNSTGYLEYGVTERSTMGLEMGLARNETRRKLAFGTLFLRRPIGKTDGPSRMAYELGVGATYAGAGTGARAHLKTGLSWGRGLTLGDRSGWINTDAAVLWSLSNDTHVGKLDTTLGMTFSDRFQGMVQLNFAHQEGETFSYFEPSLIFTPPKSKLQIQFGVITPLDQPNKTAIKLGLWHRF